MPGARKIIPASVFDTIIWRRPIVWPTRQLAGMRYEMFQSVSAVPDVALGVAGGDMSWAAAPRVKIDRPAHATAHAIDRVSVERVMSGALIIGRHGRSHPDDAAISICSRGVSRYLLDASRNA